MFTTFFSLIVGKAIIFLTTNLKLGGGSAAPGLYALKIEPNLLSKLSSQIPINVVITGTNGKTTTSRLLNHFLEKNKLKVIRNSTGSNLERGIASALLKASSLNGKIHHVDIALWEVDEAAFNTVAQKLNPNIVVFLNAFRDQLDRYGEVDTVVKKWKSTLDKLSDDVLVIANGDDANTSTLADETKKQFIFYALEDKKITGELKKSRKEVECKYTATKISIEDISKTSFILNYNLNSFMKIDLPLPGIYQIYNFLASFAVLYNLNQPIDKVNENLKDFKAAFGRAEVVDIQGAESLIMLIKNPVGATAVFETVAEQLKTDDSLLIALNDNFADGTDVSWIWDAEFEKLKVQGVKCKVICSGIRAFDLATRLKYAGLEPDRLQIRPNINSALKLTADQTKGRLFILPTYTALLELQKILAKKGIKKHYWKED